MAVIISSESGDSLLAKRGQNPFGTIGRQLIWCSDTGLKQETLMKLSTKLLQGYFLNVLEQLYSQYMQSCEKQSTPSFNSKAYVFNNELKILYLAKILPKKSSLKQSGTLGLVK